MKTIKSLLIVICLLSVFSITAYAGSKGYFAQTNTPGVTDWDGGDYYGISQGVIISWYLETQFYLPQSKNSAWGYAHFNDGYGNECTIDMTLSGMTFHTESRSGSFANHDFYNTVVSDCYARVISGTGGGVSASIIFNW